MIYQQVTLSGNAEWPKVADAVIEAHRRNNATCAIISPMYRESQWQDFFKQAQNERTWPYRTDGAITPHLPYLIERQYSYALSRTAL